MAFLRGMTFDEIQEVRGGPKREVHLELPKVAILEVLQVATQEVHLEATQARHLQASKVPILEQLHLRLLTPRLYRKKGTTA